MIFPILNGILNLRRTPVTWCLVLLNAFVMLWGWSTAWTTSQRLDKLMTDDYFVETQGYIYDRFLQDGHGTEAAVVRELASNNDNDRHRIRLLGHLAFRDQAFQNQPLELATFADDVALDHWLKTTREIQLLEGKHPSFLMGISTDTEDYTQWLTYIFSHSSGWHFAGNMVFLILFGGALELLIGGLGLMMIFVATGIFAAGFFLWVCGPSTAPLIGASGAISGIMAMFCVLNWNRPCKFVYWLMIPTREAIGFIYLPAWIGLALWVSADVAGYYGNLEILGGVAHAAHLGGDLAGAVAGLVVLSLRRFWKMPALENASPAPATWKLYPFFYLHQTHRLDTRNAKQY